MTRLTAAGLVASLFAVLPSTISAQAAQAGQPTARDSAALRSLVARHSDAVNRRDPAAVAATFTAGGDHVYVNGPVVSGREAIRDALQQSLRDWPASRRFTLVMTSARMIAPNVALVETDATFSDGSLPPNRGTMVVVREGSDWLIAALRVYPALTVR